MADLELTDQEAALLNRALAGEAVELDERQAALLQQVLGGTVPTSAPGVPEEPAAFSPKSQSGTALRGFAQGASYGFADELQGLVGEGVRRVAEAGLSLAKTGPGRAAVRKLLGGEWQGAPDAVVDALIDRAGDEGSYEVLGTRKLKDATYERYRDEARREAGASQAAHPGTFGAATVAGAIAAPGPKWKGMQVAGRTLRPAVGRALAGAATGAATGAGMSEGEGAAEVLKDTATSAGVGAIAAPLIGAGTDKLGGVVAKKLEERSRANALKAIGLTPGISDKARQLGYTSPDDLLALGAAARDEGALGAGALIRPLSTPASVVPRVGNALDEAVNAKSSAIEELQAMAEAQGRGRFNFNRLAQRAGDALEPEQGWDPLSRQQAAKALQMLGAASAAEGGFPMAEQVRRSMGKQIPWKAPTFGQALPEEIAFMRRAYGLTADEILERAKDVEARALLAKGVVPSPDDLGASNQLAAMNKRISTLMDVNTLANAEGTRGVARGTFGLKDLLAASTLGGGAGALTGDPVTGALVTAGAAGASKFARERLPSLLTHLQHAGARALPELAPKAEAPISRVVNGDRVARAYAKLLEQYGIQEEAR